MGFDEDKETNLYRAAEVGQQSLNDSIQEPKKKLRTERKHLIKKLRESRKRFHTLYDSMAEMVVFHEIITDTRNRAVDYRILDCNQAFTAVTGISRNDAAGRLASELYGTKDPPYLERYAEVVDTNRAVTFETEFVPMKKWFSVSVVPTQKHGFATITTDITERKNLEIESQKELDQKRFRLELIQNDRDITDEEVFSRVLDQTVRETESEIGSLHLIASDTGKIIHSVWSGKVLEHCPVPSVKEDFVDLAGKWFDCTRSESPVVCNDFGDSRQNTGLPDCHVRLRRFITVSAVAENNDVQIVLGVGNKQVDYSNHNVAQTQLAIEFLAASMRRRHLDRQLRTREEQHRRLFETINQGVVYFDMDNRIVSLNPAAERILKLGGSEAIGMTFMGPEWMVFAQDGSLLKYDEYPFSLVKRSGKPIYGFILGLMRREDKTPTWLSVSEIPIFRPDEAAPYQVYSIFEDITEFKKTQAELEESEAKYRAVVENSLAGVYVVQDGLIRYANKRWCEIYGYSYEEVIDKLDPFELTPPEDRDLVAENFRRRFSGETDRIEYEVRALRKDGRIITLHVLGSTILYRGHLAISGTSIDITEQRKTEEDLKRKTALLEAEVNASPMGILVVDKGRKILQNQRVSELLGIPPDIGERDDDRTQVEWVRGVVRNPEGFYNKVEYMFAHPDEKLWDELELANGTVLERYSGPVIGADGTDYGRLWLFHDITDRKRAEIALLANERRLSIAMELAEIINLEYDPANRTFLFSDAFYEFLGTTAEREGGYRMKREDYITRFVHPEDQWLFTEPARQELKQKAQPVYEEEYRIIRRDGDIRHVHVLTTVARDEYKRAVSVTGTVQNITARKQTEEALKLIQSQLMDAMDLAEIVYWDSDVRTSELILNDAFYNFYGTTAEKEGGYRMMMEEYTKRFVYPEDQPIVDQFVKTNSLSRDRYFVSSTEHRIIRGEKPAYVRALTRIIRDDSGQIISRRGANQDITEQKKTELALQDEKVRLANIIGATHTGTWEWDQVSEKIIINETWAELIGYTLEELSPVSKSTWELLIHPDDLKQALDLLEDYFAGKTEYYSSQFRMKHKAGHWIWILSRARILSRNSDGRPPMMFGTHTDITAVKYAEESLQIAKTRLTQAIDLARIVYWEYDRESDSYLLNDAVYDLYGTTAEQEGGYSLSRRNSLEFLVHPSDRPLAPLQRTEKQLENGSTEVLAHYEHRILRRNGEVRFVQAMVRHVRDTSGLTVSRNGAMQDITDRKRSEDEIRMLKHSIDVNRDGAYWLNSDNEFVYVNEAACEILGYSREELLGNTIFVVNERATEERMAAIWEKLRRDGSYTNESVHRRKDGTEFPVEILTTYIQFDGKEYASGFARDITDRKQAQQALMKSEERFARMFKASPEPVSLISVKDGIYLMVNERFLEKTGYRIEEVIGRNAKDLNFWVDENDVLRFRQELSARGYLRNFETRLRMRNGEVRDFLVSSEPIEIEGEICSINFIHDQTEQKTLEAQLRQSQKMEAIGTLAGGIAHDFNNIITVIAGFVHLLRSAASRNEPIRPDYIDQIAAAAEKAAKLTSGLLAVSRKQEVKLKIEDLNKLVQDTGHLLKRLLTEDIELHMKLTDSKPFIMADATQIDQILFNLIANARDAMPKKGGSIHVETAVFEADAQSVDLHGCKEPGRYALLSVSDNGVGMDSATRERIFEPFFTTKEVGKGTGLGLSTVYGIVAQHGGRISVRSEPNHGTTFTILFPIVEPLKNTQRNISESSVLGNETILIADDDPGVRALIGEVLRTSGYKTIESSDGEEALEIFRRRQKEIDLVMLDVVMPKMNGKDVYDRIKEINPLTRVLFISGYTRDIVLEKTSEDGLADFVNKPLLPDAILAKLREVLDKKV